MNRRHLLALGLGVALVAAATAPTTNQRLSALERKVSALEARVSALEAKPTPTAQPTPAPTPAPTPTPTPTASPAPTPSPACPASLQAAIDATPVGGTLALGSCAYTGTISLPRAITLTGGILTAPVASAYVVRVSGADVTIDGLTVRGGFAGIWAEPAVRLVVRRATVSDATYAGIMVLSGSHCIVADSAVRRIGVGQANGTNAYGIALSNALGGVATADCTVSGNTIEDVPTWHALDTHAGQRIAFTNNTVRRASRALFITTDDSGNHATDITVTGNSILDPAPVTYNLVPITLYAADGVTFTNNRIIGWGGQSPTSDKPYYDYQGLSTGLVASGNIVTP